MKPGPYPSVFFAPKIVMNTLPWKERERVGSFPTLEACKTVRNQLQWDDTAKSIWCVLT